MLHKLGVIGAAEKIGTMPPPDALTRWHIAAGALGFGVGALFFAIVIIDIYLHSKKKKK